MSEDSERLDETGSEELEGGGGSLAGFAMGVAFGAILGASLALLYAPNRGDRTRRELKRRLNRLRDEAEDGLDRVGDRARKELVRRRRGLEAGIERAADRARDALD